MRIERHISSLREVRRGCNKREGGTEGAGEECVVVGESW